jgi:aldehyde:ferredoxin oxidoreductase
MEEASMKKGYAGQIVYIDLSTGQIRKEPLDLALARSFIGGFGINARLAYDLIPPGTDPLSPQNVIIYGAGPLSGTMAPASSRLGATTKFPETGAVAQGNGSISFANQLKYAGYDHLVVSGRAATPVYICIEDERVEIRDARHLWGKDQVEATEALWREHGRAAGAVAIGPAGENLVAISMALVDGVASLGKGGLGAVMGSKNLKAIVAKGSEGIGVAHPKRFLKLVDRYIERFKAYRLHQNWVELGMMQTWPGSLKSGFHYRNRTELYPADQADRLYGTEVYLNKVKKGRFACPSCPIADKEIFEIKEGQFQGLLVKSSGWSGRHVNYGVNCNVGSYNAVAKCISLANRYGIDSHSASCVIDYVVYLYEEGIITDADTDGMVLKRDFDTTQSLLAQIAYREGLGDVLADGMRGVIMRFGPRVEHHAVQVKGMEVTQEPRVSGLGTMEFETVVNPRGAHHSSGGSPAYSPDTPPERFKMHCERMGATPEAIARILDSPLGFNAGRLTRCSEDWYSVLSSLGLCNRAQTNRFHSIGSCAEFYSAATGIEISPQELVIAGERAWNVMKASNVREGFSRKDDRFPAKWFEPMKGEGCQELKLRDYYDTKTLSLQEVETWLDDYYDERGWDKKEGIPTGHKLLELGLHDIAQDLERRGLLR